MTRGRSLYQRAALVNAGEHKDVAHKSVVRKAMADKAVRRCFWCKNTGHVIKSCPEHQRYKAQKQQAREEKARDMQVHPPSKMEECAFKTCYNTWLCSLCGPCHLKLQSCHTCGQVCLKCMQSNAMQFPTGARGVCPLCQKMLELKS